MIFVGARESERRLFLKKQTRERFLVHIPYVSNMQKQSAQSPQNILGLAKDILR